MKLFEIKRSTTKTKIMILGVKFSVKRKYCCTKKVTSNYEKQLRRLQEKYGHQKIRVGFLVSEPAKWQYQSVYEELDKSEYFEPVILVTELYCAHEGKKVFYKTIEECKAFFDSKNMNTVYAYDRKQKQYISLDKLGIDILFYQQPWEVAEIQQPIKASASMLTCYSPYGLHLIEFYGSYMEHFHRYLWKMFVENDQITECLNKKVKTPITNCQNVGYPKLDIYFEEEKTDKKADKPMIIYAPHHSFEADGILCATFQSNGKDILKLAQKYKNEINWVFKPHPRFKQAAIRNGIMSESEVEAYYAAWEKLGTIYEGGDYFDLFRQSAGLITDCCSFLGEYLPTQKPIFHLREHKVNFYDWVETMIGSYYQIRDIKTLENELERVILKNDDYKKAERLEKIKLIFDEKEKSVQKIMQVLVQALKAK